MEVEGEIRWGWWVCDSCYCCIHTTILFYLFGWIDIPNNNVLYLNLIYNIHPWVYILYVYYCCSVWFLSFVDLIFIVFALASKYIEIHSLNGLIYPTIMCYILIWYIIYIHGYIFSMYIIAVVFGFSLLLIWYLLSLLLVVNLFLGRVYFYWYITYIYVYPYSMIIFNIWIVDLYYVFNCS